MTVEFFPLLVCKGRIIIDLELEEMVSTVSIQKNQELAPVIRSESSQARYRRR